MDDETAFLELVKTNNQSELTPLERGMHALKSGLTVRDYAEKVEGSKSDIDRNRAAAIVAAALSPYGDIARLTACHRQLAEIHVAAEWLRRALALRMLAANWNVETTRTNAGRLKDVPKAEDIPIWVDRDAVAEALAAGTMKPGDVAAMIATAQAAEERIAKLAFQTGSHIEALNERLNGERPSSVSATRAICNRVLDEQADAKRRQEQEEEARRLATLRADEQAERRAAALRKAVTLKQWEKLDEPTRATLLAPDPELIGRRSFIKQKNADIEWAMYSHNPVTGCLHTCPYCYARDIAENKMRRDAPQIYPEGFAPTFHSEALLTPRLVRPPKEAERDHRHKNVFLCSMADLYGRWVPREWIEAVLRECAAASWWNFLCLTKFPKRMSEFDIPSNVWMGTTVDLQARVAAAEAGFAKVDCKVRWLSIEPMLEPLRFKRMDLFDWVVIGGASAIDATPGYPASPEWRPPFEWIADIVRQAREAKAKVYFKTNLLGEGANRILELPFDAPIKADPVEAPAVFHYLRDKAT
jgi:protein gp37